MLINYMCETKHNEEDVWLKAGNGDVQALESLYRQHYALMLNYGMKLLPMQDVVQDCIHDVFVRLHTATHPAIKANSPQAYLLKALRNAIYDKVHARGGTFAFGEELTFHIPTHDAKLGRIFAHNDEHLLLTRKLNAALNELNEKQRTALYLRFIRNLHYADIADILEMNKQSAVNLVHRTIEKLREKLGVGKE